MVQINNIMSSNEFLYCYLNITCHKKNLNLNYDLSPHNIVCRLFLCVILTNDEKLHLII